MKRKSTIAFAAALTSAFIVGVTWAETTKANPVTGETETYAYQYVGSGTWTASDWENANGEQPAAAPGTDNSDLWDAMLVNCTGTISVSKLNGWMLQLGVFGGANVTVGELGFWTGSDSCFAAVDDASSLTISATTGNNWNNTVKFYVANSGGITFTSAFAPANPNGSGNIHYYLKKSGSVTYSSTLDGGVGHVIKQADVSLTGTSQVSSKTLVSFASTTKTFTADAAIKVYGTDGTTLATTVNLATVNTTGTTTLTTDNAVGTCELVQTATGIVLYWVDGDPAAIVAKTYTPSININFISSANYGLTTAADVGLSGYAVPGTSWNNFAVANTTFSSVNAVDSTGTASEATGVSVTVSGTRGAYSCSTLAAATNPLHGYIDENGENPAPTVTISGIPYSRYRVIVYHATDSANVPFGYDTINGTDYTYVNGALTEGATAWGASGGADSANAIAEGVNVLVTGEFIESSLTVVAHRAGGSSNARGCIAAIQIIDVTPAVGENDLEIPVSGDTTYTVDTARNLTGTVYLTGNGTLTLDGSAKISAAFVNVGPGVTLNVNADRLDAPTFTGSGTVVFDGVKPTAGKGWTDSSAWVGTVWVKNIQASSNERKDWDLALYSNVKSVLRFSSVNLYFKSGDNIYNTTVDLEGEGLTICDAYGNATVISKLTGSGTFACTKESTYGTGVAIADASGFSGTVDFKQQILTFGATATKGNGGKIAIAEGSVATVASGKTWTAASGFTINGIFNVNGTLASDSTTAAVSGSGTVVFTGRAPTPTGDAWWKNANWTGTVQMKDVTLVGTSLAFNDYGNTGSVLELNGCSGWLTPAYTCTVPLKITGTLSLNDGYSNKGNAFKVGMLLGDGTISGSSKAPTMVFNITTDWSGFTGKIALNNKCVVFGSTIPDTLAEGAIYIAEGAQVTVQNTANAAWWGVGGIKVDGELRANSLDRFGGGTNITTSDNGVFTLTSTGNGTETETNIDYARIKGTGTLKYDGTGWRALSTNNFPTAVTLVNEQAGDILLSRALTYSVGSLSGTKNLQGNYGSGARYLRVVQSQDTEWGGIVVSDGEDRFKGLTVAPGATAGTLTLSGTQVKAQTLTVESGAKVNLTGTWVGDTTVSGTIGGTGKLTGNLKVNDGGIISADLEAEEPLKVEGDVTFSGAITILYPEGTKLSDIRTIVEATGNMSRDGATFTVKAGSKVIGRALISGNALRTTRNPFSIHLR